MTSANESAVKVTILPKQKKETTIIHAKNSDKVRAQTKVQFQRPFHPRTVIHAKNLEKVPVTTSAKQGAVFESILPQQKKRRRRYYSLRIRRRYERKRKCSFIDHFTLAKKEDDGNTRYEFGEGTSANKSAVLETISPQQKRKTTVIHATNLEKVPVTTSAKQGAVFESILPQQKKVDDAITR